MTPEQSTKSHDLRMNNINVMNRRKSITWAILISRQLSQGKQMTAFYIGLLQSKNDVVTNEIAKENNF